MIGIFRAGGRSHVRSIAGVFALAGFMLSVVVGPGFAEEPSSVSQEDLRKLAEALDLQTKKLMAQERALTEQQRVIADQQAQLDFLKAQMNIPRQPTLTPVAYDLGRPARPAEAPQGVRPVQYEQPTGTVGEAPKTERPEIAIIPEQGGVLTRKGQLVLEPQLEYANSSSNQFFFQGFEVVDTVLIGLIEASNADRDTFQAAMGARLGVTDRLELELRVPYLYRDDRAENTLLSIPDQPTLTRSSTGSGIGDIEAAVHYQLNDGAGGWPFFVGNVRAKSDTGKGPYDVDFDENGIATELATGSGFWGVQPSFTAIFPSDPAVFFGNLGFTWNVKRDIDKTIAGSRIGEVDPGDSVNTSFGMGIGLNDRTSFSFGFEFDYVFKTTEERDDMELESDDLKVGSVLLGWSYQLTADIGLNLNTGFGVTEDATDFRTTLRIPIAFDLY